MRVCTICKGGGDEYGCEACGYTGFEECRLELLKKKTKPEDEAKSEEAKP